MLGYLQIYRPTPLRKTFIFCATVRKLAQHKIDFSLTRLVFWRFLSSVLSKHFLHYLLTKKGHSI